MGNGWGLKERGRVFLKNTIRHRVNDRALYQGITSKESKQRMKWIHWCYLFDTTEMTFIMKSREVSIKREILEQTYRL